MKKRGIYGQTECYRCAGPSDAPAGNFSYWGLCTDCFKVEWRAQQKGRAIFVKAKRTGKIPPARNFDCVDCGKKATEWDHRSYARPLDVEAVCRSCNQKRGPAEFSPYFAPYFLEPAPL